MPDGTGFFARLRGLFGDDEPAGQIAGTESGVEVGDGVGLDPNPQLTQDDPDPGGTLPEDEYPQDDDPDGVDEIAAPPPPPDLTNVLDADPATTDPGVTTRLDGLDLEEGPGPELPGPGPETFDLGVDGLDDGGLDTPLYAPELDVDLTVEPPAADGLDELA